MQGKGNKPPTNVTHTLLNSNCGVRSSLISTAYTAVANSQTFGHHVRNWYQYETKLIVGMTLRLTTVKDLLEQIIKYTS